MYYTNRGMANIQHSKNCFLSTSKNCTNCTHKHASIVVCDLVGWFSFNELSLRADKGSSWLVATLGTVKVNVAHWRHVGILPEGGKYIHTLCSTVLTPGVYPSTLSFQPYYLTVIICLCNTGVILLPCQLGTWHLGARIKCCFLQKKVHLK